ncbi:MAG TPA: carboxypeptidase regulatory-like domain-containing protein [Armatimonadota bacterium]
MLRKSIKGLWLGGALVALFALLGGSVIAQTWWNPDYTQRVGLTITNNDAAPTPVPTTAEVRYSVHSESSPGTTDYTTLPTGTKLTFAGNGTSLDDNWTVVTLPFQFPWGHGTVNQLVVGIDGYIAPGAVDLGRPDNPADAYRRAEIIPWSSDFAITDTSTLGVYADLQPTQATFRWEVQESASGPLIAKFAVILKPDGSIRFVYGNPCNSPSAAIADPGTANSYSPIKFGIGGEDPNYLHVPAFPASNTGHADLLYTYIPAAQFRSDGNDVRALYWSGSAWQELDRQVLSDLPGLTRVVFRLVNSIPAGGTSTGQYFLYLGNTSPQLNVPHSVYNIYDHVEDFLSAANVVGSQAPNWVSNATGDATTVVLIGGKKMGQISGPDHARGVVLSSAMPGFLNAEEYAHVAPSGGECEVAPMIRAVGSTTNGYANPDLAYTGGFGYVMDGFGSQNGPVSYVNPKGVTPTNTGPADMGVHGPDYHGIGGVFENFIIRCTGLDAATGALSGKVWKDGAPQPYWGDLNIALNNNSPSHQSGVPDPLWNQPGTVGVGSYSNSPTVDFIAIREIRNLSVPFGAPEVGPAFGPGLRGVISSSKTGPLANLTFTITDGTTTYTLITGANGEYHISLPAGSYSVTASAFAHTTTTVSGVSPTTSGVTNVVLPYVGATVSGVVRDALTGKTQGGTTITLSDATGHFVVSGTSDANGNYSIVAPAGGVLNIGAVSPLGLGGRTQITVPSDSSTVQNLAIKVIANGDMEVPNFNNSAPVGWTTQEFTPSSPAGAFEYINATDTAGVPQHTPGGNWVLAVKDPGETSAWNPPNNYAVPAQTSYASVTVSVWVYFTAAGQRAALRLRNNFPTTGSTVGGRIQVNAGGPNDPGNENQSLATVPVGQWFELRKTAPAGTALSPADQLGLNLYARGPAGGGAAGTVYFDDLTITVTPSSSALGKVVDAAGNPVASAFVGPMTSAGGLGGDNLLTGPFVYSDDQGNFTLFQLNDGPVTVGAWAPVLPDSTGHIPGYGNLISTATLNTSANPTTRTTITVGKAGVVSAGAAGNAGGRNDAGVAQTVDNNLFTRWDGGGGSADVTVTYDLGSTKSIDQIEVYWEAATPDAFSVEADPDLATTNSVLDITTGGETFGIRNFDITPFNEGSFDIIRLPASVSARYIKIHATTYGTYQNYSIIEMRALSAAAPIPPSSADVTRALQIAGGLVNATSADKARLDKDGDGRITVMDAVKINKAVNGL